jgi:NADH:ubiquinone oxidoreductase subunit 5 (subunit L)/multisubunit Na+/H+ antiporter MnhA subunit
MAILGFTGGLLHVLNHAVFKSLLFLGAGSVLNAAGAGEIDRLGGLLKRMPVTGSTFLIGAAAICGLPPLNGFVSEFLIYLGALASLSGDANAASPWPLLSVLVVGGLALIGGLAIACFTKAAGIAFLGEPRSNEASRVREAGFTMRWPMIGLAGLCVLIGLTAPLWPIVLQPAVAVVAPEQMHANLQAGPLCPLLSSREARTSPLWETLATTISPKDGRLSLGPLMHIMFGSYIVLGLVVFLVSLRRGLLANRRVEQAETWGCGYVAPTPRVQYTGSSFVQPLALLFRLFLQPRDEAQPPHGLFPTHAKLHTHTPDLFRRFIYEPVFAMTGWIASQLHRLQEGHIQVYVLYIALTILVLLIWKLG